LYVTKPGEPKTFIRETELAALADEIEHSRLELNDLGKVLNAITNCPVKLRNNHPAFAFVWYDMKI
jgi:hypothetical protein